jgi:predicted nucleic acid-binding protein
MAEMIIDSYAWIEFLNGTKKGEKVKQYLKRQTCYISVTSLSEIVNLCLRLNMDRDISIRTILSLSKILALDKEIALMAGRINFERKKKVKDWGMMDSFILAFAISKNLKILTGDKQFSDLQNVEML